MKFASARPIPCGHLAWSEPMSATLIPATSPPTSDELTGVVNPKEESIEGLRCRTIEQVISEDGVEAHALGLSVITPPKVSAAVVRSALEQGINHIWLQPGWYHFHSADISSSFGLPHGRIHACVFHGYFLFIGAEDGELVNFIKKVHADSVIHSGPCVLVELGADHE